MKRTQHEIKLICEEISINVARTLLAEEKANIIQKTERGEIPILLCYDMLGGYFCSSERIIRMRAAMLKTQLAFDTYKKRVEERL